MPRKFNGSHLVLATHNAGKIAEMTAFFTPHVPYILTAKDLNLAEPPETGTTFLENATLKARAQAVAAKMPVLADDSGLCIEALNGAPGVYTADWAGHPRNFRAAMMRVLQEMGDTHNRAAHFETTLVLAWPDGHIETAHGRIDGQISRTRCGLSGFGYDPIFIPNSYAKTFAEMPLETKKAMSHRTQAIIALLKKCF